MTKVETFSITISGMFQEEYSDLAYNNTYLLHGAEFFLRN